MFESERTDDQILSKEPIKVRLGSKDYEFSIPSPRLARAWRAKLFDSMGELSNIMKVDSSNVDKFYGSLGFIFLQFPERLADLVFLFAPDVPREQAEDECSEEQLARAFGQVMQVAYPFAEVLGATSKVLGMAASLPAPVKFTN
jgi:hypothetical protein